MSLHTHQRHTSEATKLTAANHASLSIVRVTLSVRYTLPFMWSWWETRNQLKWSVRLEWVREIVEWNGISTSISNSCASLDSFSFYVTENFQHCIFLCTSSNARERMLSTVHPLHPVSVRCSPNAQSTRSIRSNTKFQPKAEYEVSQWKFTSPNRVCDFPIHPQLTPTHHPHQKSTRSFQFSLVYVLTMQIIWFLVNKAPEELLVRCRSAMR